MLPDVVNSQVHCLDVGVLLLNDLYMSHFSTSVRVKISGHILILCKIVPLFFFYQKDIMYEEVQRKRCLDL